MEAVGIDAVEEAAWQAEESLRQARELQEKVDRRISDKLEAGLETTDAGAVIRVEQPITVVDESPAAEAQDTAADDSTTRGITARSIALWAALVAVAISPVLWTLYRRGVRATREDDEGEGASEKVTPTTAAGDVR